MTDHLIQTEDGVSLHARLFEPSASTSAGSGLVLLFFHGNAGNLSGRDELMLQLAGLGADVLIFDYRGYGHSEGRPSERGLYRDARAAWRFLTEDRAVPSERIVLFGKSLGGAAAVHLATEVRPAGLIVQSSFTSIPDLAARFYPFVPQFLIRTRMESVRKIGKVDCPTLVIHSNADEIVPFAMGRQLFEEAREPKWFYEVEGAGHNETLAVGGGLYLEAIGDFLTRLTVNDVKRDS